MPLTGTSTININIEGFYNRNLLQRLLPELKYSLFGQIRPLPKNKGSKTTFRRYGSLAVNTTQLTEGTTPAGKSMSASELTATMGQYGDYVTISDQLIDMGLDPILVEAGKVLGEQAGLSLDTIYRAELMTGTTVRYANGVANRTSIVTAIQANDIKSVVRNFEAANVKKLHEMLSPSVKVSTHGLRPAYIGITHPDNRQDLENLSDWRPVEEYASTKDLMADELGEAYGVRFIATTNAPIIEDAGGDGTTADLVYTTAITACDVYQTLILGRDAYGIIPLQKGNVENIVKRAKDSGTEDPLNQRNTSGWKAYTTIKILNDNCVARIEHGVSDL